MSSANSDDHALETCQCGKPGIPRIDNGLACGVHCDQCWRDLINECRSRSW